MIEMVKYLDDLMHEALENGGEVRIEKEPIHDGFRIIIDGKEFFGDCTENKCNCLPWEAFEIPVKDFL